MSVACLFMGAELGLLSSYPRPYTFLFYSLNSIVFSLCETPHTSFEEPTVKYSYSVCPETYRHVASIAVGIGNRAKGRCKHLDLQCNMIVPDYQQVAAGGDGVALTYMYSQLLSLQFNCFYVE